MEKCLTRAEVAERYQISEEEVVEFEAAHRIPILRFGKAVRYDAQALAAFDAAARGTEPPAAPPEVAVPGAPPARGGSMDLFDLREAISRLGCGRTFLLGHLAKHPFHDGKPTHRRVGNRFMFSAEDFERLLATMVGQPDEERVRIPTSRSDRATTISGEKAYQRALKLLEPKRGRTQRGNTKR